MTRLAIPVALLPVALVLVAACSDDDELPACSEVGNAASCVECLNSAGLKDCAGPGCFYDDAEDECSSGVA